jgi:hypothetical protein
MLAAVPSAGGVAARRRRVNSADGVGRFVVAENTHPAGSAGTPAM